MKNFGDFLRSMNPYSESRLWKIGIGFGIFLMVFYLAYILPLVGMSFNLDFLGYYSENSLGKIFLIGYGGFMEINFGWYVLSGLLGMVIPWTGLLIYSLSMNYYKGLKYIESGVW